MRISDELRLARGVVTPCFVDVSTGRRVPFSMRHNTLSYSASDAVAAAFGGDPTYIPSRMGFIYGTAETPTEIGDIDRNQSWSRICEELSGVADIQVVGFSYAPTLGVSPEASSPSDDVAGHYRNNAVTFHAVSNSQTEGAISQTVFSADSYIYQCVLLGGPVDAPVILARASLLESIEGEDKYLQKPKNFEVALDWTVIFH